MSSLKDIVVHQQEVMQAGSQSVGDMSKDQLATELVELMEFLMSPDGEEFQEDPLAPEDGQEGLMIPMGHIDPNAALLMDSSYAGL